MVDRVGEPRGAPSGEATGETGEKRVTGDTDGTND